MGIHVSALCDAARGAVTFGNEEGAFLTLLIFGIEVDAAVAQLFIMNLGLTRRFTGRFLDAADLLALLLVGENFLLE